MTQARLPEPAALSDRHPAGKVATSVEAFDHIDGARRATGQARVIDFLTYRGIEGATCDEVCVSLDMPVQTVTARLNDLFHAGLAIRDGRRRPTRTGSSAFVWTVKGKGVVSPLVLSRGSLAPS